MPRNTVNSRQTAKPATNGQGPSGSRRRPPPKRVSFADEQGDAAATIAQQKKEQEKFRAAQAKIKAAADKAALKEQREATKRREKEEATRRKEQEDHVARLETEVEALRREKELEEQRAAAARHEQELHAAAIRREEEERAAMQRGARMTTEELVAEAELREPYSPRTLAAMKRDEDLRNGPYEYSVRAVLKVQNGSQTPTKWSNKIGGLHVKGSFDIHALNIDLDAAIEQHGVSELSEIRGWAKSTHSKGTRQNFTLDTISIEQWEQRVESITTAEWKKRPKYILDVELVCTGRIGLRRGIQAVDGPAQSPSHRRTRTSVLEDQHAVVRDRQESLGDVMEQLITRWTCQAASCNHQGTCWIDENGEHHKINAVMRERWAAAIQDGQATQYQPPLLLYKAFVNANSSGDSQKKKKTTPMEQMKAMMEQQMELGLLKSMRSMANMASEES